ncbi:large ribosomal subunit protein bL28 [Gorillibacterium massiliense]|uniref:large ribosomal subunit protein bL28 n=1 Tax=Gorillibacterium massiliense TaxID=1280390 RepID=UPI0004B414C8|nr:L28 family ribosomal protein [Gorillibacterium massiliense]
MAKCSICSKTAAFGKKTSYSHSHVTGRHRRVRKANIQRMKILIGGVAKHAYVCTGCLKSGRVVKA